MSETSEVFHKLTNKEVLKYVFRKERAIIIFLAVTTIIQGIVWSNFFSDWIVACVAAAAFVSVLLVVLFDSVRLRGMLFRCSCCGEIRYGDNIVAAKERKICGGCYHDIKK